MLPRAALVAGTHVRTPSLRKRCCLAAIILRHELILATSIAIAATVTMPRTHDMRGGRVGRVEPRRVNALSSWMIISSLTVGQFESGQGTLNIVDGGSCAGVTRISPFVAGSPGRPTAYGRTRRI